MAPIDENKILFETTIGEAEFLLEDIRYRRHELSNYAQELGGEIDEEWLELNKAIGTLNIATANFIYNLKK